jgi:hypothetical protein
MTTKGNLVYIHVLEHEGGTLEIPGYAPKLKAAHYFDDQSEVVAKVTKKGLKLTLPKEKMKPVDTVIVLTLK